MRHENTDKDRHRRTIVSNLTESGVAITTDGSLAITIFNNIHIIISVLKGSDNESVSVAVHQVGVQHNTTTLTKKLHITRWNIESMDVKTSGRVGDILLMRKEKEEKRYSVESGGGDRKIDVVTLQQLRRGLRVLKSVLQGTGIAVTKRLGIVEGSNRIALSAN